MNGASTAVWPGQPYPLGATWDGEGVNFALFSEHAEKVELCLYDAKGRRETARIPLQWKTDLHNLEREVTLDQLPAEIERILGGKMVGRVVVNLS